MYEYPHLIISEIKVIINFQYSMYQYLCNFFVGIRGGQGSDDPPNHTDNKNPSKNLQDVTFHDLKLNCFYGLFLSF